MLINEMKQRVDVMWETEDKICNATFIATKVIYGNGWLKITDDECIEHEFDEQKGISITRCHCELAE